MATTTRILDANVNGTVYTANANDALEALDTCHSGATAPTDEVANGKLWLDTSTTPGILKIYNNATWEVVHSGTVDINGGAIDGTTIGATTPAAVNGTTLTATGLATFGGGGTGAKGELNFLSDSVRARILGGYLVGVGGGYLSFHTDTAGGSDQERMRIDNNGLVNITGDISAANLNLNTFSCSAANDRIALGAAVAPTACFFLLPISGFVPPTGITVTGTFNITTLSGSPVTGGTAITPVEGGGSSHKTLHLSVSGLTVTSGTNYYLRATDATSSIKVNY